VSQSRILSQTGEKEDNRAVRRGKELSIESWTLREQRQKKKKKEKKKKEKKKKKFKIFGYRQNLRSGV
jgi:hypothetical protein